jgi:hypothetical protein
MLIRQHAVHRFAQLTQNKTGRKTTHKLQLIGLAGANFKTIFFYARDRRFNHFVDFHNICALHIFRIEAGQELSGRGGRREFKNLHGGILKLHAQRKCIRVQRRLSGAINR